MSWYTPPVQYLPWERDTGAAHFKGSNMAKIVAGRYEAQLKDIQSAVEGGAEQQARRYRSPRTSGTKPREVPVVVEVTGRRPSHGRGLTPPPPGASAQPQGQRGWWLPQPPPSRRPSAIGSSARLPADVAGPPPQRQPRQSTTESMPTTFVGEESQDRKRPSGSVVDDGACELPGMLGEEEDQRARPRSQFSLLLQEEAAEGSGGLHDWLVFSDDQLSPAAAAAARHQQPQPGVSRQTSRGTQKVPASQPSGCEASSKAPSAPTSPAKRQQPGVWRQLSRGSEKASSKAPSAPTSPAKRQQPGAVRQLSVGNEKGEVSASSWPSYLDPAEAPSPNVAAVASLPTTIVEGRRSSVSGGGSSGLGTEEGREEADYACSGSTSISAEGLLKPGGANARRPWGGQRAWDFPLSGKEKADRAVLVGMKEAELAEAWAEVSDRRAQRYCLEASELRIENARLQEIVAELQVQAALRRGPACRKGRKGHHAKTKTRRLARRRLWARCVAQRLRRVRQEAAQAGAVEAKLRWATEKLAEALQENARLRSQ